MSNSTGPSAADAKVIAHALRGVATAVETVGRGRSYYLSEMGREMVYELTTLLRQYATDLDTAAAQEPSEETRGDAVSARVAQLEHEIMVAKIRGAMPIGLEPE